MSDSQRGFATPALAVIVVLLVFSIAGVSFDLWRVVSAHQKLVAITDSAAVAGAGSLNIAALYADGRGALVLDPEMATDLVCEYLAGTLPETACPGPQAVVWVDSDSITVTIRTRVPLTLLRLLLRVGGETADIEVGARATASPVRLAAP